MIHAEIAKTDSIKHAYFDEYNLFNTIISWYIQTSGIFFWTGNRNPVYIFEIYHYHTVMLDF